jgi:hypothetical protein
MHIYLIIMLQLAIMAASKINSDDARKSMLPVVIILELIVDGFGLAMSILSYRNCNEPLIHQALIILCIAYAYNIVMLFICLHDDPKLFTTVGANLLLFLVYVVYEIIIAAKKKETKIIGWEYQCATYVYPAYIVICFILTIKAICGARAII